jgi:hypothetical protein
VRPSGIRSAWLARVALVLATMALAVELTDHLVPARGEAEEAVRVLLSALVGVSVFFLMAVRMGRSSILAGDQLRIRRPKGTKARQPAPTPEPRWRHRQGGTGPRRP